MRIEDVTAYELIEKYNIKDLDSVGYLLRHKKTGARVALLSNDDENKVFYIGFRTPPKNSTGVAHILEHSVLCGSKNFPLKDPFVELVKGSLNTFLNAMTYPDKTVYPVASCNDKDFQNLMHVYLDAVFYPNIYTNKSIFRQEGWHYELKEGKLSINGVVYNEMKGAFSSPDDVLDREIMNGLFPDTAYGVESGGDPDCIPELSYEEFLEFHKTYYHPSNSYIYLYGNMDMAEKLTFLDEEYLSKFDFLRVESSLQTQESFEAPRYVEKECPIAEGEKIEDNTFLSSTYVVGNSLDRKLYIALEVLEEAILSMPGAPLNQALIDNGIGQDVYSVYNNGIKQPYFGVVAKGAGLEKKDDFLRIIRETLTNLVQHGINRKSLLAVINRMEFRYREADFGSYPKGLMYGLQMLDSWLYDDKKPFIHIEANETFATLRRLAEEGYFEDLIDTYLLKNPHNCVVVLKPVEGLMERKEKELADKLSALKDSMTAEQLQGIETECEELKAFQEREDSKENLEKLPLLTRADMKQTSDKLILKESRVGETTLISHDIFTNGIGYMRFLFKLDNLPGEYYPYVGILRALLGMINTKQHSYLELNNEIRLTTGGFSYALGCYGDRLDDEKCTVTLEAKIKALYPNMKKAMELLQEILFTSDFTDTKRIYDILQEARSGLQASMVSAGHSLAVMRASSYGNKMAAYNDEMSGIRFYRQICDILDHYDEQAPKLVETLQTLCKMVFRRENLLLDFTGSEEETPNFVEACEAFLENLYTEPVTKQVYVPELRKKNEGFMTSGQIQYVCRAGNYKKNGLHYTGALRVLKVIMGYEYLWTNVRVKGGAYGCMCGFSEGGDSYFVSYRDPNLEKTIEVYEKAALAVADFKADERTMTKYIIGTFSGLDMPLTPQTKGARALACYLSHTSYEMLQKEREEILNCSVEDIRALSAYIKAFMEDDFLCVVGNASKIKEREEMFLKIENLF